MGTRWGCLHVLTRRCLGSGAYSLTLQDLGVQALGLRALQEISSGMVLIHHNPQLCFLQKVPWGSIFRNPRQRLFQTHNKPPEQCGKWHPWVTGGELADPLVAHGAPPAPAPCRKRGAGLLPPLCPRALLGPRPDPVHHLRAVPAWPGVRRLLQPPGWVRGEPRGRRAEQRRAEHPSHLACPLRVCVGPGSFPRAHPHGPLAPQSQPGARQRDAVRALPP